MSKKVKIGDRVGAIRNTSDDGKTVYSFGYGTYSEEIPPSDPKGERGMVDFVHEANITNPKLTMDDGTVVWGAESWWGPEETIKKKLNGLKIVIVKPPYELEEG